MVSIRLRLVRTLTAVTLAFAVLAAGLAGLSSWRGFLTVEDAEATRDAERTAQAVDHETHMLSQLAEDWASGDDILAYVRGTNPGYQPARLTARTLQILELSNLVIVDSSGAVLWSAGHRSGEDTLSRADVSLVTDARPGGELHVDSLDGGHAHVHGLDSGPALVAAMPITDGAGEAPVSGTLVMTRALGPGFMMGLADRVQRSVALVEHDPTAPAQERTDTDVLSRIPIGEDADVPAASLVVTSPRTVSAVGRSILVTMTAVIVLVLLLMGLLVLALVDRMVIRRLIRLRDDSHAIRHRGSEQVHVDQRGDELSEVTEAVNAMVASLHDAHDDLATRNLELAELARLRRDVVAVVSHELRTPLTTLVGFARTLGTHGEELSVEQRQHFLQRIQVNAQHLSRLVGDLLVLSRADDGDVTVMPANVDVVEAVADLEVDLTMPVTSLVTPGIEVRCDPDHLRRMLANLLQNANKYGAPPFEVSACVMADEVCIEVRDHGDGVPAEFVPRLFERFTQASTGDNRTARGVGLGLSIVQALAASNDGRVLYLPSTDGAAFGLVLPRALHDPNDPDRRAGDRELEGSTPAHVG